MKKITIILCLIACLVAAIVPAASAAVSNQGWIQIVSNVNDAYVYFDGLYQGQTSNGGQLVVPVYMAKPVYNFRVEKSGFTTVTGTLTMPVAGATTTSYAMLREMVTATPTQTMYGSMAVDSSPAGARIFLDGRYIGTSSLTFDQITPGSHTIDAVLGGYYTYTTMVGIRAGSTTKVFCTLQPSSSTPNSIYTTSNPTNAFIYVDNIYRGKTPFMVGGLSTGNHEVMLNAPGYESWKTTVSLPRDGSTMNVFGTLRSLSSSSPDTVHFISDPTNAFVYVDNAYRGKTPLTLTDISSGNHDVLLSNPGYENWKTTLNLPGDGSTRTVSATMITLTASPTTAPTLMTPLATQSPVSPIVVIAALGIITLIAGLYTQKK